MVKIIAKQPVNEDSLAQLELLVDLGGVNFADREADGFTADSGDVRAEVKGRDIPMDGSTPTNTPYRTTDISWEYDPASDFPLYPLNLLAVLNSLVAGFYLHSDYLDAGFKYLAGKPLPTGEIEEIKVYVSDELAYTIKNANIKLKDFVSASSIEDALNDILKREDTFRGSNGEDVFYSGRKSDKLSGKGGDDELHGEAGADTLDGGAGDDLLDGGAGNKDVYLFKDAPGVDIDTIVKFQAGETIKLSKNAFAGLPKGTLSDDQFVEGTVALDAEDRILLDEATGALAHDPDGVGGQAATQFATIQSGAIHVDAGAIIVV